MKRVFNKNVTYMLCCACIFVGVAILMYLSHTTGDDWYFEHIEFSNVKEFISAVINLYNGENGRVFGNISSLILSKMYVVREFIKTLIVFLSVVFINKLIFIKDKEITTGHGFTMVLIILSLYIMPNEMYRETYNWMSGFFNYVPTSLLTLIYLYIIRNHFYGKEIKDSAFSVIASLIIGFASCLYLENLSIYIVFISVVMLVWYFVEHKKISWTMAAYSAFSVVGTFIMLMSPVYRGISSNGEDWYRKAAVTKDSVEIIFAENYCEIVSDLFKDNLLIIIAISLFALFVIFKNKKRSSALKYITAFFVCIGALYCYASKNMIPISPDIESVDFWVDLVMWVLYALSLILVFALFTEDKYAARFGVFSVISIPVSIGPLLFVQPIGPRCFYFPYVFLLCIMFLLITQAIDLDNLDTSKKQMFRFAIVFFALGLFIFYFRINYENSRAQTARIQYSAQQVYAGEKEITVSKLPYPDFAHDPGVGKFHWMFRDKYDGLVFHEE